MAENLILAAFVALPLLFLAALVLFHRHRRRHPRPREGAGRVILGNALLLLALVTALLPAGEVYYRFLHDSTDSFGLTRVTREWFARHYRRNRAGFRDSGPPPVPGKPDAERRVTFFGDSFTAGQGVADVEDRFPNLVRAERPGWDVQVIARNGWDTPDELAVLEGMVEYGWWLDDVVLVYCPNDIALLVPEWRETVKRVFAAPPPGFLVRKSYLVNTLYYRRVASRDPALAKYYGFVLEAFEGPCWERHRRDLTAFRDAVRSRGGRLLVVTWPFLHAIGPDYPYRAIHERLAGLWRDLGVPHLDLLDRFEGLRPGDLVVGRHDAHPNERAHRLAAAAILEFLGNVD